MTRALSLAAILTASVVTSGAAADGKAPPDDDATSGAVYTSIRETVGTERWKKLSDAVDYIKDAASSVQGSTQRIHNANLYTAADVAKLLGGVAKSDPAGLERAAATLVSVRAQPDVIKQAIPLVPESERKGVSSIMEVTPQLRRLSASSLHVAVPELVSAARAPAHVAPAVPVEPAHAPSGAPVAAPSSPEAPPSAPPGYPGVAGGSMGCHPR